MKKKTIIYALHFNLGHKEDAISKSRAHVKLETALLWWSFALAIHAQTAGMTVYSAFCPLFVSNIWKQMFRLCGEMHKKGGEEILEIHFWNLARKGHHSCLGGSLWNELFNHRKGSTMLIRKNTDGDNTLIISSNRSRTILNNFEFPKRRPKVKNFEWPGLPVDGMHKHLFASNTEMTGYANYSTLLVPDCIVNFRISSQVLIASCFCLTRQCA